MPNTIASEIGGVQPLAESCGEVFKMSYAEHECNEECGNYHLVHDFVKGYVWRNMCTKLVIDDLCVTDEEIAQAHLHQIFTKPIE